MQNMPILPQMLLASALLNVNHRANRIIGEPIALRRMRTNDDAVIRGEGLRW